MFSSKKKELATEMGNDKDDESDQQHLDVSYSCSNIDNEIELVVRLRSKELLSGVQANTDVILHVPMRLVCVIDASHSMAEPYGTLDSICKLDRIKMFAQLLINGMNVEDYLGIVTFGTSANVVLPLAKLSTDIMKENALETINNITIGGVTNMGAGLCTAIDLFKTHFRKSRFYNDNVILFTDGMANEGFTDTESLTEELMSRIDSVKEECQFDDDYTIKLSTLGTGGFYPELLFNIGQIFGSDSFYFLDDHTNMELNLMKPILFRQYSKVSYIDMGVTALNGVNFDREAMPREYEKYDPEKTLHDNSKTIKYFIHDIPIEMEKNFVFRLKLPNKHKKCLKNKDVVKLKFHYRDSEMSTHQMEVVVPYCEVPRKPKFNLEEHVLITARHTIRLLAQRCLIKSCIYVHRLDRIGAKNELEIGQNELIEYLAKLTNILSEDTLNTLTEYSQKFSTTLQYCTEFVMDLSVRWDDAWARIKSIASSYSRELPTAAGVLTEESLVYRAEQVDGELAMLSKRLAKIYQSRGLSTEVVEQYGDVIIEFQERVRRAKEEEERLILEEQQPKSILLKHAA